MKRLVGITGAILIICVLTSTFFVPTGSAESVSTTDVTVNATQDDVYIIKSLNNRIAVYKKGEAAPFMKTETRTDNLPKGDILHLERGIEIVGKANLRKALEDYCS